MLRNYLLGITGTGAGSGDEPHEPHEVERAIPAAAAASAIIFTNFIVLISIVVVGMRSCDPGLDLHARRTHPLDLHASAARTKESEGRCCCNVNESFEVFHKGEEVLFTWYYVCRLRRSIAATG